MTTLPNQQERLSVSDKTDETETGRSREKHTGAGCERSDTLWGGGESGKSGQGVGRR